MMIEAIFERGIFRPLTPVELPEGTRVTVATREERATKDPNESQKEVFEILSRRYRSGETDTAARHNEHQP